MENIRRITLAQVARAARVSVMTVSMALRNHPRISTATRKRIQALAARLGYRPDPTLTRLMTYLRTTRTAAKAPIVAHLVSLEPNETWHHSPYGQMFDGARERAEALGYRLETFWLKAPGMTGRHMSAILRARGIEGALIAPILHGGGHLSLDLSRLAVASVGSSLWLPQMSHAQHDYFHGTMLTMRHLTRLGYRRIGLVTNQRLARTTAHQQEAAFLYYTFRFQYTPLRALILTEWNPASFQNWFEQVRPDAVVTCYTDVMDALAAMGCGVPKDVGVALDWIPERSSLSGVQQDYRSVGAAAFDLVEGQLRRHEHGIPTQPKIVLVRGWWVDGATVRRQR